MEAFEGAKFSYPGSRLRDIHATTDGNRITAHASAILKILREAECFFRTILDFLLLSILANIPKSFQEVPRILHRYAFSDSN